MNNPIINGLLLDEQCTLTLIELTSACQAKTEWLIDLVDEGILQPSGRCADEWRFAPQSILLAQAVRRLQQDLELNLAGAALVLGLRAEIERLRARLALFESS